MHSNVDWKESRLKDKLEQTKKDLPTACLAPSFATVVLDKQLTGCDEVGTASVARVSKSTQREECHTFCSRSLQPALGKSPKAQPPPLCSHTVLMLC